MKIIPVYTTEEAIQRVRRLDIDVCNAKVVVDVLTNDVRGTRQRPAASPEELVERVDRLRRNLLAAGADGIVICQLKPMEVVDVTPYISVVHDYLQAQGGTGYGTSTQIRRNFLKPDGFHIQPQFAGVIDRTYACALMGIHVPDPTPWEDFAPDFARRRRNIDWPKLVRSGGGGQRGVFEGPQMHHGWRR